LLVAELTALFKGSLVPNSLNIQFCSTLFVLPQESLRQHLKTDGPGDSDSIGKLLQVSQNIPRLTKEREEGRQNENYYSRPYHATTAALQQQQSRGRVPRGRGYGEAGGGGGVVLTTLMTTTVVSSGMPPPHMISFSLASRAKGESREGSKEYSRALTVRVSASS
jgi:hypothetical protein